MAFLIDEYDTPIVELLDDPKEAEAIGRKLARFYEILKSRYSQIGYIFMTGVSRFTETSIFF
jgi:hypothetical protein